LRTIFLQPGHERLGIDETRFRRVGFATRLKESRHRFSQPQHQLPALGVFQEGFANLAHDVGSQSLTALTARPKSSGSPLWAQAAIEHSQRSGGIGEKPYCSTMMFCQMACSNCALCAMKITSGSLAKSSRPSTSSHAWAMWRTSSGTASSG